MIMIKKILLLIILSTATVSLAQVSSLKKEQEIEYSNDSPEMKLLYQRAAGDFQQRLGAGGISVRGNMTFIANNILNRSTNGAETGNSNYSYNGTATNNSSYMKYIDIDTDPTTRSSSSSTLNLPNCSRVVYAGLYWFGVYPTRDTDPLPGNFNDMKLKLPSSTTYQSITATGTNREIIFDGAADFDKPYICFKDITALVQAEPDPNGVYTAAEVKASEGTTAVARNGSSAGWGILIIYENDNESSKNISIFDGFTKVSSGNSQEVKFTGFKTIDKGPVKMEKIVASLEGDIAFGGDALEVKNKNDNFIKLSNKLRGQPTRINQTNNFFNSSISIYNQFLAGRTPSSTNTLGVDFDLFDLRNNNNNLIENSQTEATFKFTSGGDVYWPFLSAMSVEIIEPKIKLVKTIEDAAGADIAGTALPLGAELFYNLSFESVGTDNAKNTVIIDRLPKNVDLIEADIQIPPGSGITYIYAPPVVGNGFRGEITFNIPDNLVQIGDPVQSIKLKVQVVNDCSQLRDVCSNQIENQAFANYSRDLSALSPGDPGYTPTYNRIENTPSFAGIDVCNLGQVGTSNFLIDTSGCTFERDEILCGGRVAITAGAGFDTYSWVGPNGFTANTQTIVATEIGTYTVTKVAPAGCIDATEIVNVVPYTNAPNPLIPFADRILTTCPSNTEELAEIYLCGVADSKDINLNFGAGSTTTVKWFKLDSCPTTATPVPSNCANINTACTWTELGDNFSMNFDTDGEYRLDVLYDGRCPSSYYFNVFKATLNPIIVKEDIICGTDGTITINSIPTGYQYQLTGPNGYNVPFQDNNTFTVPDAGDYNLTIRLNTPPTAASCEYTFPAINIQEQNIDLNIPPVSIDCAGDTAEINVSINGSVPGPYTYTLTLNGGVVGTQGPIASNNYRFDVNEGGNYVVTVTSEVNGACLGQENILVAEPNPLTITPVPTKDITCKDGASAGIITLNGAGGTIDVAAGETYTYAVWEKDGVPLYANVSDIPSAALSINDPLFLTNNTYSVPLGSEGRYRFVIIDSNDCYTISEEVEIEVEPELQFNHIITNVACNGEANGIINVSLVGNNLGYLIEYSIDGGTTWDISGIFNTLTANPNYTITIRASKATYQCNYSIDNIPVTEPEELRTTASVTENYTCSQQGEITFATPPDGGTGPFLYGINGVFTNNPVKPNLTNATYTLAIRDANNCTFNLPNIVIPDLPAGPTFTVNIDPNCDNTGAVSLAPVLPGYEYSVDGQLPLTDVNSFNLSAGNI